MTIVLLAAADAHARQHLFAQPNASSAVSIQLSKDSVRVDGVTPGGTVVIFMAALRSSDGIIVQRCEARALRDADGDGVVLWPGIKVPLRSVWFAADLRDGRHSVVAPEGFDAVPLRFRASSLRRDFDGVLALYDLEEMALEALVLRPAEGAWRLRGFDGGSGDGDAVRNGRLTLPVANLTSVAGLSGSPPRRLKKGDVLAIIEPNRLELLVLEIEP